jgi:hypothetical protein
MRFAYESMRRNVAAAKDHSATEIGALGADRRRAVHSSIMPQPASAAP